MKANQSQKQHQVRGDKSFTSYIGSEGNRGSMVSTPSTHKINSVNSDSSFENRHEIVRNSTIKAKPKDIDARAVIQTIRSAEAQT